MSSDTVIEEGLSLLDAWAEAFNTREPARVAALYAEDAFLHGTSQARLRVGMAEIRAYFRGTATVEFGERHFVGLSDGNLLSVGNYRFSRTQDDGREIGAPARFTFLFQRREGVWKILHHHSSAEPS
ncbi:nuclear transport factor 2 family protein [Paraburkholderia tuberum]|nr:nuclear transport factor 2 family protein [Paraburkholderia tuberum]